MYMSGPPSRLGELNRNKRISRSTKNTRGYRGSMRFIRTPYGRSTGYFSMGDVSPPFKAPAGYKWEYEVDGLSGLGRFSLRKIVKSVVNVAKKVVMAPVTLLKKEVALVKKVIKSDTFKKLAPIALLATGAYFAAPWFIALAKTVGASAAQMLLGKHAPSTEPMTADEAARAESEITSNTLPDWIAGPAQALIASRIQGEAQAKAAQAANQIAIQNQRNAEAAARAENEVSPQGRAAAQVAGETPGWVLPAAIGGAALLLITTMSN